MKDILRRFKTSYVALDINNSDVRVVAVRGNKVDKFASSPLPDGAVKDGMILEPQTVTVIIDNMFNSLNLSKKHVITSVTGLPFIYRTVTMPKGGQRIPDEAVERAAKKEMSLSRDDMFLLWEETKTPKDEETDFFVLGVPKNFIKPVTDTLNGSNIKPYVMDVRPLALARALALKEGLIVSLEKSYFDIVVIFEGAVRILHGFIPVSKPEALSGLVNELIDGLNMAVKSFNRDYPQNTLAPDTPIYLTGALAANTDMAGMVQESTGHPVNILKPAAIDLPDDMSPELYAGSIGLILKRGTAKVDQALYTDIDVNLLAKTIKPRQLRQTLGYAAAVIFVLLLAALVYQVNNMKNQAFADVDKLTQENVKATQVQADAQKAVANAEAGKTAANEKLTSLSNELKVISGEQQKIVELKYDYAHSIDVVTAALPVNSDYINMSLQPDTITVDGQVSDPFAALTFNETLERTDIFSTARVTQLQSSGDAGGTAFTTVIINGK
jgi:type IV pilus assembly protein PilM